MARTKLLLVALSACFGPAFCTAQTLAFGTFPATALGPAGDVSGDGIGDLIAQSGADFVVLDGVTGAAMPWLTRPADVLPAPRRYTALGDYDGDGKDDLCYWVEGFVSTPSVNTVVSGADGHTLSSFTTANFSVVGGGADYDGDGRSDLLFVQGVDAFVVSARTGAVLRQDLGSPNGGSGPWYRGVVPAGDTDGDGRSEVILAWENYTPNRLRRIVGASGTSMFLPSAMAVGDVNRDGKADLWTGFDLTGSGLERIIAGGSQATLWSMPNQAPARTGDLDSDGFDDMAFGAGSASGTTYTIYSGATQSAMTGPTLSVAPQWLGDLDGDGRSECAVAGSRFEWQDPTSLATSRMLRRGKPGATSDGRRPYLVTRGHCGLGHTVFFDMRGCMPNGLAVLTYGSSSELDLAPFGAPDNHVYTSLDGEFWFVANAAGIAQYRVTVPATPTLLGAAISAQSVVADPSANALGLVLSNAIDLSINN